MMATTSDSTFPFFTEFADQSDDEAGETSEIVIPEDLSELGDEELETLHSATVEAFNALYGEDGSGLTEEGLEALAVLTEGVERVKDELTTREQAATERAEKATAMARRVNPGSEMSTAPGEEDPDAPEASPEPGTEEEGEGDDDEEQEQPQPGAPEPKGLAASSRSIRVNLSGLRSKSTSLAPTPTSEPAATGPTGMRDIVVAAPEFAGFTAGQGLTWDDIGQGLDRRLASFNRSQWESANATGRHVRSQLGALVIHKPFDPRLVLSSDAPGEVDRVLQFAMKEARLPGNSLTASGGWCAPSQMVYDLCELETRDGLLDVPEIGITRGGINRTLGPDFADIYADTGFCYTEADDIAGDYDGSGGGSKPCYTVECPPFEDHRLDFCGVCINAGLLMARGYPEVIARVTRGALIVHDHKMSARSLTQMVTGSTAVTMAANQAGATAPLLTAVELVTESMKQDRRLGRGATVEAVFPFWVRGAIRADLSRRLGVDLLDVPDTRIDGWFRDRGINPQFVYNWQPLPAGATSYPATVQFLVYGAGTWVRGTSDIITIDTLYDSVMLGTNDFTALFTEEGILMVKMCHDSRAVTVSLCPDGSTAGGIDIACDGSAVPVGP